MRTPLYPTLLLCFLAIACSKQSNTLTGGNGTTLTPKPTISVLINDSAMNITQIDYNRSNCTFNFSAWNNLQRVDVKCFWFYQQNWGNYQYSDSINYSSRPDTLTEWHTIRAINYGSVLFDCCTAPLTDSLITGTYTGQFLNGKSNLVVGGTFHLQY